jgi:sugar lactone lactonase YvrE
MLTLLLAAALAPAGCVGGPNRTQLAFGFPPQHCAMVRGRSEQDLKFADLARSTVAVASPDGRFVYATTRGAEEIRVRGKKVTDSAIAVFARRPGGALRQLRGRAGCVTPSGRRGCARARAIEHVSALAIAPDGRSLYAAANKSGAIAVFRRDTGTGALRQLAGRRGCLGRRADGCARADRLGNAATLLVSADGRDVYAESLNGSRDVVELTRDARTGALRWLGCVSLGPHVGTACRNGGAAYLAFGLLDQSPDGRYVISSSTYGLAPPLVFARGADGRLRRVAQPCVPACGAGDADPIGRFVIAPEGTQAYELSVDTGEVAVWSRDPATGVLSGLRTAFQTPCDPNDCHAGPGTIAFAPGGRTAYVAFSQRGVLFALARDPATGVLSPLGCWSLTGADGCTKTRGLLAPEDILVTSDGSAVYAVTQDFAISAFSVDTSRRLRGYG